MDRIEDACAFLRGERKELLQDLEEDMKQAAANQEFERATALRDTLFKVRDVIRQRAKGEKSLAMRKDDARAGVDELQSVLGLTVRPRVIECYDISNISGTHAVGSMVSAVEGRPARSRYRLFRIKSVEGSDDPRMMAEVMRRRFARADEEKFTPPDLVMVDGGITQLRAARREMDELGFEALPAFGLAKQYEEIVSDLDGRMSSIRLPNDSKGLHVLQRIRDEAHRFALTYHRKLRSKRIRESKLDDMEGIGEKRKELLLQHFGSIARLEKAGEEQISMVPGIGPALAKAIYDGLHTSH